MAFSSPRARRRAWPDPGWGTVGVAVGAAVAAAAAGFTITLVLLPPSLVVPVAAAGLALAAAAIALIAWLAPPELGRGRVVYWDIAGALTLIGLCAALFGEPEQAVTLLERDSQ